MSEFVVTLLVVAVAVVLLTAVFAPFETLRWWGGMSKEELDEAIATAPSQRAVSEPGTRYVVYLSGIGSVSGDELVPAEVPFLTSLQAAMPDAKVLVDVFPYSVTNNGLTGQRMMSGVFRWVSKRRWERVSVTELLINLRNALQVAVSADQRYGPVFNFATAKVVRNKLLEHEYRLGSGERVTLIGYSGGAQIAIGVSSYLEKLIGAPIRVISLGGVMTGDNGIGDTEHLYHIYSEVDELEKLGSLVFPGRWPVFTNSAWNIALRTGQATLIVQPGMTHTLVGSYMDPDTLQTDGRTNLETTVSLIADLVRADRVGSTEPGSLSNAQFIELVRRLQAKDSATAEAFVALLDTPELAVQQAVARAELQRTAASAANSEPFAGTSHAGGAT